MKRVLTAVVLAPLVLLAVFRAPLWLFALLVAAVIVLALHEYLHIAEAAGLKPFKWLTYAVSLLPIVVLWVESVRALYFAAPRRYAAYPVDFAMLRTMSALPFLTPVIFGVALVFRKELQTGLASAAASVFGVFYLGSSLSLLISLRADRVFSFLLIFILLSVWAGDIAAYYVGRSIGKHKLAPIVSPNKSWEGAVASVIASVAVAILVFHFAPQVNKLFGRSWLSGTGGWTFYTPLESFTFSVQPFHAIILGVLTNVAAQFGDLFESALKRGANLKDSGTLLPGHGGVLDRIDALLFAIPVVWYYAHIIGPRFIIGSFE
jgi:phosphatidate cytidylyltransferase